MSTVAKFRKEIAEQEQEEANAPIPFDPGAIGGQGAPEPEGDDDQVSGDNAKDYTEAAKLIEAIEKEQAEIDKLSEQYKHDSAPHRDEMKSLKKTIRDDYGIEAKALSLTLRLRRQARRDEAAKNKLEEPAKGQFEQLEMAL